MANASALLEAGIDFSDEGDVPAELFRAGACEASGRCPVKSRSRPSDWLGWSLDGPINGTSEYEEAAAQLRSATARQGPAAGQYR
jgi:hypothetical protein